MFARLLAPYPLVKHSPWQFALVAGALVTLVLVVFRPEGMDQCAPPVLWSKALGFGCVTFLIMLVTDTLTPRLVNEDRWTLGKEILYCLFQLALICVFNYFFLLFAVAKAGPASWQLFGHMVKSTFMVGAVPVTALVFLHHNLLLKQRLAEARQLNDQLQQAHQIGYSHSPVYPAGGEMKVAHAAPRMTAVADVQEVSPVHRLMPTDLAQPAGTVLISLDETEPLELHLAQVLYIAAADNYIEVYSQAGSQVRKSVHRGTLKKVTEALTPYPQFFRCHRSYVVNLDLVTHVDGNSQGYRLHLAGTEIPVSRNYTDQLRQLLVA